MIPASDISEGASKNTDNAADGIPEFQGRVRVIPGGTPVFGGLLSQVESSDPYLNALNDFGIGVAITQGQRFIQVNNALCAMYGYTSDELLQLSSYMQLVPEEEHQKLLQNAQNRLVQKIKSTYGETSILRRDGKRIDIEYFLKEFGANGNNQSYAFIRDITERKEHEKRNTLLASAVESTTEIITITDLQNRFFFLNKAFLETYGYSEKEILGKCPGMLSAGDDGDLIADDIWRKTQVGQWRGTLYNKRKDGTIFPIQLSTSPIIDQGGKVLGYIGVGRDITELNEAEQTLLRADERFRMLFSEEVEYPVPPKDVILPLPYATPLIMRALAEHIHATLDLAETRIHHVLNFSSFAAHELRIPLTILRSSLESILDADAPVREMRKKLSQVYDEVLRLIHMTGMLLEVGRMQTGSLKLELQPIDLATCVGEFCEDARHICRQKEIDFTLGSAPIAHVRANSHYLCQVFFNLLDNSCKHTPTGGRINLDYTIHDREVVFQFSDSGSGILPDDLLHVFEPFFKGSESESRGVSGAGLGLAFAKWVVEAHEGQITVKSQVGSGTTFEIRLPSYQS